ncbi:MAG TPA: FAD-binding oxidoreductase [Mycobacteriales bacterium]|nr:FAD-binding oxidoreductase [Mycobacteriales bacterium]
MEPTWWGWGEKTERASLSPSAQAWLAETIGRRPRPTPRVPDSAVRLGKSEVDTAPLQAIVGAENVRTDRSARLQHTGGKSYVDLIRRRADDALDAPDAVVLPADHEQVAALLRACSEHAIAVVPFGGGTSVVGGVEPVRSRFAALIALDLRRLDALVAHDPESLTATLQAGLGTPRAEELLGERGLMLGHTPQSAEFATIGGYAATRSAGAGSTGFGRFDELVQTLRIATPAGDAALGRIPASAAGPDLRALFLGSEGALGVITEVGLRVRRIPPYRRYEAFSFPSFRHGYGAARHLVQDGAAPDVLRLSDTDETAAELVLAGAPELSRRYLRARGHGSGSLLIIGWEGTQRAVRARRAAAVRLITAERGIRLGTGPGRSWLANRFAAPYLRDTLLDAGLLAETLETAAPWSALPALHQRLRRALHDALGTPLVMGHISHAYPTGASLYLTVLADRDDADPIGQWQRAKAAANEVITAAGATISHHHGIGLEHRDAMTAEVGPLGLDLLRAVKSTLDPVGILNPGKLIPAEQPRSLSRPVASTA